MNLEPLLHYFATLTPGDIQGILAFIGSATGISVLLLAIKPKLKQWDARYGIDAKKVLVALMGIMSFTLSVASDILSSSPQTLQTLTGHATEIIGLATLVYHFGVSPLHARIMGFFSDVDCYLVSGELPVGKPKS